MNDKKFKAILKSYDKKYEFRLCEESEYLRLIDFLDKYWHKNHVLATSKNLMDWQYLDKKIMFIILCWPLKERQMKYMEF